MEVIKIFGSPGTGKTTYLMGVLEKELTKLNPSEIAFVSFTQKGTYEGRDRAMSRFNLKKEDLPYFKTIHALCFREEKVSRDDMLQVKDFKRFSKLMGIKYISEQVEDQCSASDSFLFVNSVARNNPESAVYQFKDLNIKKYRWIIQNYMKMKRQLGKLDYTDLLENYLKDGEPLPVKVAIVDEAQDLTKLQWKVVQKLFQNVDRLYIAGDDDQAIYSWAGADVKHFLDIQGKDVVLKKSYRLPREIHLLAMDIVHEIKVRHEKVFKDNGTSGEVEVISDWADVKLNPDESTLILTRNNLYLKDVEKVLRQQGLLYFKKGDFSISNKVIRAIKAYEEWRVGKAKPEQIELYKFYYRQMDKNLAWYDIFNLTQDDLLYYRMVIARANNGKIVFDSNIHLETIHTAKGSEADHVILALDITNSTFKNLERDRDSELRTLYVGVTRAKKKLTVKLSGTKYTLPKEAFIQMLKVNEAKKEFAYD